MNKLFASLRTLVLVPSLLLLTIGASAQKPSYVLVSAPFLVNQKTQVPGHILDPGAYSIRIVDRLRDRFILRVDDTGGQPVATFIGLHNPEFGPFSTSRQQGPIFWTAAPKGSTAVRGFSFANGNTLEFVYPKGEAVRLAKLNTYSVPAIDPESEGRKPDPKLSTEDREIVTLWMLSATRIGPKQETPAIEAKRFVAPVEQSEPIQAATATPKPQSVAAPPVQVAQLDPPPVRVPSSVKRLPKTSSSLPLMMLLSVFFVLTAGGLHLARNRA